MLESETVLILDACSLVFPSFSSDFFMLGRGCWGGYHSFTFTCRKNQKSSIFTHHYLLTPIPLQIQLHALQTSKNTLYAVVIILHFVDCYYSLEEKDDCFSEDAAVRFGTPPRVRSQIFYLHHHKSHHHHNIIISWAWVAQHHREKRQEPEKK